MSTLTQNINQVFEIISNSFFFYFKHVIREIYHLNSSKPFFTVISEWWRRFDSVCSSITESFK